MSSVLVGLPRHPPFAELTDRLRDSSRCVGLPRYRADACHPSYPPWESNPQTLSGAAL